MRIHTMLGLITAILLVGSVTLPLPANAQDKAPTRILITNVNVWDGTSDEVAKGTDVLVEGNKIKTVAKGISADGAHVIDGKGGTLTPGLIDMHQHLLLNGGTQAGNRVDAYVQGAHASRAAEYLLRNGFTTIRDIAGNSIGLKNAINTGILPGPRVYTSGPAIGPTGGHSDWGTPIEGPGVKDYQELVGNTAVVDGRAEWLRQGRWNLRNGADFLKVMAGGGVASTFEIQVGKVLLHVIRREAHGLRIEVAFCCGSGQRYSSQVTDSSHACTCFPHEACV